MNKLLVLTICLLSLALSRADDNPCKYLNEYTATTKGEVTSPSYNQRDKYQAGLWCEYRIRAPPGNRIKVSFKAMAISPSSFCKNDHLIVTSKDKQKILAVICGNVIPKPIVSLPGESEIRLIFKTHEFQAPSKGFVLEYESGRNLGLCNAGQIECRNRNCFDSKKKCDGEDDCGDGTDEENCGFPVVQPKVCGTPTFQPRTTLNQSSPDRMVGGDIAVPNSWPWQVSLQSSAAEPNAHFCGGTLINSQWVVTATHCVVRYPDPRGMKIVLGSHNKYNRTKYEQVRYAARIIAYPDLEGANTQRYEKIHDISLIKLNAPVKFNDGVQPACLPSLGSTAQPGWHCYISGWGTTRGSGGSDVLKQQEQIVQPRTVCNYNPKAQICVEQYKQSACHGDSGGPLQCKVNGKWFLFGAASYVTTGNLISGGLCTGPGARTVYTNVGDKADWIRTLVNKYS